VQMLHLRPYDAEPETVAKMFTFMKERGLVPNGLHHEIGHADANGLLTAHLRAQLSRQTPATTVVNQPPKFSIVCVSERFSRGHVSWTSSSASLSEPSMRYPTARRRVRCSSNWRASHSVCGTVMFPSDSSVVLKDLVSRRGSARSELSAPEGNSPIGRPRRQRHDRGQWEINQRCGAFRERVVVDDMRGYGTG
jgi:hypothetical protein